MKPDTYHIGVVVEQASTTVAVVTVRAGSREEAEAHAARSLRNAFFRQDAGMIEAVASIMDWQPESYSVQGYDNSIDWAEGYDVDVDLTDEPTDAERRVLDAQAELNL